MWTELSRWTSLEASAIWQRRGYVGAIFPMRAGVTDRRGFFEMRIGVRPKAPRRNLRWRLLESAGR